MPWCSVGWHVSWRLLASGQLWLASPSWPCWWAPLWRWFCSSHGEQDRSARTACNDTSTRQAFWRGLTRLRAPTPTSSTLFPHTLTRSLCRMPSRCTNRRGNLTSRALRLCGREIPHLGTLSRSTLRSSSGRRTAILPIVDRHSLIMASIASALPCPDARSRWP